MLELGVLFVPTTMVQRSHLPKKLGCKRTSVDGAFTDAVEADFFGATSINGLYIVGDASRGAPQVTTAVSDRIAGGGDGKLCDTQGSRRARWSFLDLMPARRANRGRFPPTQPQIKSLAVATAWSQFRKETVPMTHCKTAMKGTDALKNKLKLLVILAVTSLAGCIQQKEMTMTESNKTRQPKHKQGEHQHAFANPAELAQKWNDPERDKWQRPEEIISAMDLKPGAIVADIGAGTGYMVAHLSRATGTGGTVIAVDASAEMIDYLANRTADLGPATIVAQKVGADDPELKSDSIDAVLALDTWHHMNEREAYAKKVYDGLKRGGRFVVVDHEVNAETGPPKSMRLEPGQVMKQLEASGFRVEIMLETMPRHYMVVGHKDALETNTSVTTLNLNNSQIGDIGAQAIGDALHTNTSLKSLGLQHNQIGDIGAKAVCDALQNNVSLQTLWLSNNRIGDPGADAMRAAIGLNTTLATLYFDGNPATLATHAAIEAALKEASLMRSKTLTGDKISKVLEAFSDPLAVARYAENPPRMVPGFADLLRMTTILLAERVPDGAHVLVLGAGGGLDLKALVSAHPGWTFDGVDPSAEMLKLAEKTLGPLAKRTRFHQGYIDDAPTGPFDGATCILTLHFMPIEERQRVLAKVHRRLKPGAPFVVAHFSLPQGEGERALWLSRYAAFAISSGMEPDMAEQARAGVDAHLNILTPEQDEAILREAGFSQVSQFYTGFTFRGWVAYA